MRQRTRNEGGELTLRVPRPSSYLLAVAILLGLIAWQAEPIVERRRAGPQDKMTEREAAALILGRTRPADGMTFGEWSKRRAATECKLDPDELVMDLDDGGEHVTTVQLAYGRWKDRGSFRELVLHDHGCAPNTQATMLVIGAIDRRTGRVVRLDGSSADAMPATRPDWVADFDAGRAP